MIQPIEKKNVADEVFEKMLNMIIEGDWKKGEMIPSENELREAFTVSRSTVRQAVQRLSALGIVRSRQGKGTYVEQVDTSFYLNLLIPSLMLSGGDSISILEFTKSIQVECVRIVSQCVPVMKKLPGFPIIWSRCALRGTMSLIFILIWATTAIWPSLRGIRCLSKR